MAFLRRIGDGMTVEEVTEAMIVPLKHHRPERDRLSAGVGQVSMAVII